MTLHAIAETLHKMVWEIEAMPASEYMDWIRYFDDKQKQSEGGSGNLLEMPQDEMIGELTGG